MREKPILLTLNCSCHNEKSPAATTKPYAPVKDGHSVWSADDQRRVRSDENSKHATVNISIGLKTIRMRNNSIAVK